MDIAPKLFSVPSVSGQKRRHLNPKNNTSETDFWCNQCGQYYRNYESLKSHQKHVHKKVTCTNEKAKIASNALICPVCFEPQGQKTKYEEHLLVEHEQKLDYERFELDSWQGGLDGNCEANADNLDFVFTLQNLSIGKKIWKVTLT